MLNNELREVRVELSEQLDRYNQLAAQFQSSDLTPSNKLATSEEGVREGPEVDNGSQ